MWTFFVSLQQVMGHSDMKVSLTYLRGLEVKQIIKQIGYWQKV